MNNSQSGVVNFIRNNFVGAFAPTIYHSWRTPEQGMKMLLILALLVITFSVVGYLSYKRLMKACDSIIEQLQLKEKE